MKSIKIKELKPGDIILNFDPNLLIWIKCKIIRIEKYRIALEYNKLPRGRAIEVLKRNIYLL